MASVLASGRRNGNSRAVPFSAPSVVRCAIYCRQSVSEGTAESASITVQREACQNYIAAHHAEGWVALPDVYADQGISGATLQRAAMQRLLVDAEADRIDAIVCYKLDRVSRSMADFAGLVAMLERRRIRLVSITQSFDSDSAIGRLLRDILMSFSEFERGLVSERTRDAMVAARRKGRYVGGSPMVGFDVAAEGRRLIVNEFEAFQVRELFKTYIQLGSLIDVATWANEQGWRTKALATKNGTTRGGVEWSKSSVHRVLSAPAYIARQIVDGEAYATEHPAIIDEETWRATQEMLERNGGAHTRGERHRSDSLLGGLLRCPLCSSTMTATFTRKGARKYEYLACSRRQKGGKTACSQPYVSAAKAEAEVVQQLAGHSQDPALIAAVTEATRQRLAEQKKALTSEKRAVEKAIQADERYRLGLAPEVAEVVDARLKSYRERVAEIEREAAELASVTVGPEEVGELLRDDFQAVWGALTGRERRRVMEVLVERIVCDGSVVPILGFRTSVDGAATSSL